MHGGMPKAPDDDFLAHLNIPPELEPLAEEMRAVLREAKALKDEAAIVEFATSERVGKRVAEVGRVAMLNALRSAAAKKT